ncbi:MAG: lysophospholipase [Candidatus Omnitrophica bacterium]|nr:lysophospholipase [Candidatus Omnitrophota bacterium]MBU4467666.1 lysophospholipase [Candidatus Omnitrophota bacterium]MCG2707490.1 lysophospholipase [Candidatus Omnitrophota bacterium]
MKRSFVIIPLIVSGFLTTPDHQKIAYRHYKGEHDKVVVIAHGFYNSKDAVLLKQLADSLTDKYDVLMFDFRGHGKSSGLYTWTSREEKDLKAALDFVEGKYKKVGIIAFSLGASIAINTLSHGSKADSLICVSAASDPNKVDYQLWKLNLKGDLAYTLFTAEGWKGRGFRAGPFWLKKEKPIDNVAKLNLPILFIHGEKDWVIRPWHSQVLYDKVQSSKKLLIIKNGSHAEYLMKDFREEFLPEVKSWFESTL